jgi:DNA-binding GntR family transcriptional regulator
VREHEAILDALRRRAGAELSDTLFLHLRHMRTAVLSRLAAPEASLTAARSD